MNVYVDGPWADKQDKLLRYVEDEHSAYIVGPLNVDGMEIIHTDAEQTTFVVSNNSGITTAIYSFGGNNPAGGYDAGEIYIGASWFWPDASSLPTPGIYSHEGRDIHIIANDITLSAVSADTGVETYFDIGVHDGRFKLNTLEINCSRDSRDSVFVSGPSGGIVFDVDLYNKNGMKISGFDHIYESDDYITIDGPVDIRESLYVAVSAFIAGPATFNQSVFINGPLWIKEAEVTQKICANSLFVEGPTVIAGDIFATDVVSPSDIQGLNMRVNRSHTAYPDSGLGIKEFTDDSADGGIRIYPSLCSYHTGPHICGWNGPSSLDPNMHIVSGRGGGIALTIQDSYGSPRTAHLTYENITKLIALLESAD